MGTLLCALDDLVAEVPPGPTTVGRYGNAAFREWRDRAARALPDLVRGVGVTDDADVAEVVDLLGLCWGNATRLDYGSGHEAAFLVVLFVLSEKVRRGGGTGLRRPLLSCAVSLFFIPPIPVSLHLSLLCRDEADTLFWHQPNAWCWLILSWCRLACAALVADLYPVAIP